MTIIQKGLLDLHLRTRRWSKRTQQQQEQVEEVRMIIRMC